MARNHTLGKLIPSSTDTNRPNEVKPSAPSVEAVR